MPNTNPGPVALLWRPLSLLVALLAALSLGVAATQAVASDVTAAAQVTTTLDTDGVTTGPTGEPTYWDWERVTMRVTWAVPDSTRSGDHFTVPIDPALAAGSFIPFDLLDPEGAVVARATVSGNLLVFTMTSYVDTHQNVHGTAFLQLEFALDRLSTTVPNVITVYGTRIRVTHNAPPTGEWDYKYAWWQPTETAATSRDERGVLVQRTRRRSDAAIQLKTRVGSPLRDWSTLTIIDTPASGTHFSCARDGSGTYTGLRPRVEVSTLGSGGPPAIAVVSCAPDRLVLRVTKQLTDRGVYHVTFDGWLDTDAQGRPVYRDEVGHVHLGFHPAGYGNSAVLDYDGWTSTVANAITRATQGGTGVGDRYVPRVDIEKYQGEWNGITFVDGRALLDEAGQPASLPAGDFDAAPGLDVAAGAATTITLRITNTGGEVLNQVRVTDAGAAAGDLTTPVCTLRGSTAMPFDGLAPGESFTCTLTLRAGFTSPHRDVATVTAVGATTGAPVTDRDEFHAFTTAQPPVVTPPTVTPPTVVVADTPKPLLRIRKVPVTRRPWAGGRMTWRVVVRNVGRATARPVAVCDRLVKASLIGRTARVRYVGKWTTMRVRVRSGRACIRIPRLDPGQSVTWVITTRVSRIARGVLVNRATASTPGRPTVRAEARRRVQPFPGAVRPAVTG
ncbi:MAG: Ig-like domain-containing protein [Thermoleophilia bacterium]